MRLHRLVQRPLRLRAHAAIHGKVMIALERFHRMARVRAKLAIHPQRLAMGIGVTERAKFSLHGAHTLRLQRQIDRRLRLRADLAVHREAMVALERLHRMLRVAPEIAVYAERASGGVGVSEAMQLGLQRGHLRAAPACHQHAGLDSAASGRLRPQRRVADRHILEGGIRGKTSGDVRLIVFAHLLQRFAASAYGNDGRVGATVVARTTHSPDHRNSPIPATSLPRPHAGSRPACR